VRQGGILPNAVKEKVPVPSAQVHREVSDKGYEVLEKSGVDYSVNSVVDLARQIEIDLSRKGLRPEFIKDVDVVIKGLQNPPPGAIASIADLEAARQALRQAGNNFNNPREQKAAKIAIDRLSEFMLAADPRSVVAGRMGSHPDAVRSAQEAAKEVAAARGNYAAAKRSETLSGKEYAAELRADAANSGQNLDNNIRGRIASLLLDKKESAGFTAKEREALEGVVRGTFIRNSARNIGNYLGGGGGLGASALGLGGAITGGTTGVAMAALPVVGNASKRIGNALTSRALNKVDEATRMRSPLYEALEAAAPMTAVNPERRAALIRALLLAEQQQ
jgi:hypothetical protein